MGAGNYGVCSMPPEFQLCALILIEFRLKRFFKRSSPKPVKLDDSELFQLHSPTFTHQSGESLSSPVLPREQLQEDDIMDESIPPLPPPMPTLEQLRQSGHRLFPKSTIQPISPSDHPGKKQKTLASLNGPTKVCG